MAEHDSRIDEKPKIRVKKDEEFASQVHQLLNQNQTGANVAGHYMQVDGAEVKCNALSSVATTKFKIWTAADDDWNDVCVLESKEEQGKVVAIENSKVLVKASPVAAYTSLSHVQSKAPEILFYKFPKSQGSELCYFKHFETQDILGFDAAGNAMDPSTVQAKTEQSLFSVLS